MDCYHEEKYKKSIRILANLQWISITNTEGKTIHICPSCGRSKEEDHAAKCELAEVLMNLKICNNCIHHKINTDPTKLKLERCYHPSSNMFGEYTSAGFSCENFEVDPSQDIDE